MEIKDLKVKDGWWIFEALETFVWQTLKPYTCEKGTKGYCRRSKMQPDYIQIMAKNQKGSVSMFGMFEKQHDNALLPPFEFTADKCVLLIKEAPNQDRINRLYAATVNERYRG